MRWSAAATRSKHHASSMRRRPLLTHRRRVAPGMAALFDLLDDLRTERFQITWIAAGDDAVIHDHGTVQPLAASVHHIGPDGVVRRHLSTAQRIDFYQQPRRVTHRRDHLAGIDEFTDELQ